MPVKRSESRSYLAYGSAKAHSNYRKAFGCLLDYISESNAAFDIDERSEAAILLGEICCHLGDSGLASFFADLGMNAARGSLIINLLYAKFIGNKLDDANAAINICETVLCGLKDGRYATVNGDFSIDEYIQMFAELSVELSSRRDK